MIEPYRIIGYDVQGEFPDGCVAVRIAGPGLPQQVGLPFITFSRSPEREIWAERWRKALNAAYNSGVERDRVYRGVN